MAATAAFLEPLTRHAAPQRVPPFDDKAFSHNASLWYQNERKQPRGEDGRVDLRRYPPADPP